jgi:hypothetical protein
MTELALARIPDTTPAVLTEAVVGFEDIQGLTVAAVPEPVKVMVAPSMTVLAPVMVGVGFTVTMAVMGVPLHFVPLVVKLGVMVKVTVTGALVVLVNIVPKMLPLPLVAMPVISVVLSLVQL